MKTSSGKFFVGIGILLVIAGVIIWPDDNIIGIIGVIFGVYNVIKGIRLLQGIQPMIIRKQQERYQNEKKELEEKKKQANKKNRNKKN